MNRLTALALAALLLPAVAVGKDSHAAFTFDPLRFAEQRAGIEKALKTSSTYREISDEARRDVLKSLAVMDRLLTGVDSVAALDPRQKTELFNHQENVNALLGKAARDSRLVCSREKATGSHRITTRCRTIAQIREASQAVRRNAEVRTSSELPEGARN